VTRAETLWLKIIGVLLILVGLVLFASPRIVYTAREKLIHTGSVEVTAKRQETLSIPRSFAMLIIMAGIAVIVAGVTKPR
jgi:uncharacterized membrane protein YdcZ (DUF606 family)